MLVKYSVKFLQSHFSALEELVLENQYGSCIVSNIVRQLLFNCNNLQSLTLQLGRTFLNFCSEGSSRSHSVRLIPLHWFEPKILCLVCNVSTRYFLFAVDSLDDVVMAQVLASNSLQALVSLTLDQCHSVSGDSLHGLLLEDSDLQLLNVWSCRFVTTKHREMFRKIIARESFDLSLRYMDLIKDFKS